LAARRLWWLECRRFGREPGAWWATAVVLLAGITAIGVGEARYEDRLQQLTEIRAAEADKVARLRARAHTLGSAAQDGEPQTVARERAWGARTPGFANAWSQLSAIQRPAPLAMLAAGLSDLYPMSYGTSWRDVEPQPSMLDPRDPMLSRAGWFDLAFVLLYLLPIAILAGSVDLLACERDAGTWPLIRSNPVAIHQIVVTKLAPHALAVSGCVFVLGVVAAWRTADPLGVLAWQIVVAMYAACWFAVAVLISVAVRHASAAAAGGFAAWFTIAIIMPATVDVAVGRAITAPPEHAVIMATRAARAFVRFDPSESRAEAALQAEDGQAREMLATFLSRYPEYRDAERLSPWGRYGVVQAAKEEALAAHVAPLRQERAAAERRRERWLARLSWVSPTLVASRALWRLANVDQRAQAEFQAQARAYDRDWKTFFWPLMFRGDDFTPEHYDRIPQFVHRLPSQGDQLWTAGWAACVLLANVAVVGVLVWRMNQRAALGAG
jgi:ABC-2 type transport system permease protein